MPAIPPNVRVRNDRNEKEVKKAVKHWFGYDDSDTEGETGDNTDDDTVEETEWNKIERKKEIMIRKREGGRKRKRKWRKQHKKHREWWGWVPLKK